MQINGVNFIFSDTAGIRKTNDKIENIGILKAIENFKKADIILFVVDNFTKEEDFNILKDNNHAKKVLVYNKLDLNYKKQNFKNFNFNLILETSNKNKESIVRLKQELYKLQGLKGLMKKDDILILNQRQKEAILKTIKSLNYALSLLKECCLLDVIGVSLEEAIENILELSGKKVSDFVLDEIFSKFCVGK